MQLSCAGTAPNDLAEQLIRVQSLLEDLHEAGQEARLEIDGFELNLVIQGETFPCANIDEAEKRLLAAVDLFTQKYGEMGRPDYNPADPNDDTEAYIKYGYEGD